jgi:hypothetical protein
MLKHSITRIETPDWRIFFIKDPAAVEEAVRWTLMFKMIWKPFF